MGATRRDGHISATDTHPNCAEVKRGTNCFARAFLSATETQGANEPPALRPANHADAKETADVRTGFGNVRINLDIIDKSIVSVGVVLEPLRQNSIVRLAWLRAPLGKTSVYVK